MDPEPSKPNEFEAEFQAKIKILTDIVMSLGRSISEHDEHFTKLDEQVSGLVRAASGLVQVSSKHQQAISRLVDITTELAETARTHEREIEALRESIAAHDRHLDEHLDILTRLVDDWIRRKPRDSSAG